jgi:hypothetical protein
MFCTHCGKEINLTDKFCASCGNSLSQDNSKFTFRANQKDVPYFGKPLRKWWLSFGCKNNFSNEYSWISERNTLIIYQDYLALFRGDEKRSYALDVVSAMGLVGGLVAGVRSVKDQMNTNEQFSLDTDALQKLFDEKLLVWCKKDDAEIWRYNEKPWMFIKSSSEQLFCRFESSSNSINAIAKLWCTAESGGHAKGDVDGFGCKVIHKANNISEKDVPAAMAASIEALPN